MAANQRGKGLYMGINTYIHVGYLGIMYVGMCVCVPMLMNARMCHGSVRKSREEFIAVYNTDVHN